MIDAVMGDYFRGGWDNLGRGGRYVVYGAADLTPSGDLGIVGWIKLAWKYLRRPFVDPTNLPAGLSTRAHTYQTLFRRLNCGKRTNARALSSHSDGVCTT